MKYKNLTLVRHAKSSWEHNVTDSKRPLAKKGINDANLVSKHIKKDFIEPDAVFSSPANRALTTCSIFSSNLNIPDQKIKVFNELYDFNGESVIRFIKSLNNDYNNVMIFGHNHAFTSISNIFGNKFIDNLPTSGVVIIKFDTDKWENIDKGQTELIVFPKLLK